MSDLAEHMRTHHGYPVPSMWNGIQLVKIHSLEHDLLSRRCLTFLDDMVEHSHAT